MKGRARIVTAVAGMLMLAGPAALAATEPDDTIAELELRGYYADPEVDVDIDGLERLVADQSGEPIYFVALAEDPAGGADLFADEVLRQITGDGTVVVVSPGEIGARSTVYDDEQLGGAIDESIDRFDVGYLEGFRSFASAVPGGLAPDVVPTTQASAGADQPSGGGGGGLLIFLLIVAVVGALIFFMVRRAKRQEVEAFEERVDEIKAEIRAQMSGAADDILELEDEVLLSDNEQAKDLFAAGSQGYAEFEGRLEAATTLAELHDLAEDLDRTMWQLDAAEALVDGKPLPPEPADRPDYEPPARRQPVPGQTPGRPDLPPDLQMRTERGERIPTGSPAPRRRSGDWLGGLGTAAVILRSLQQGQRRRSRSGFQLPGTTRRTSRGSGVQMPDLGGGGSRTRQGSTSGRGSSASTSRRADKPMRGRARRKR